jgi:predicted sulfurtransferase
VLFYAYTRLSDPVGVVSRLLAVCQATGITGKLRIAAEGINGTAAGTTAGIQSLVNAMRGDSDAALAAAAASMDYKPAPG